MSTAGGEGDGAAADRVPLNHHVIYPGNACFGCGPNNPEGLRIEIHRDYGRTDRLLGFYRPRETASGFPGIAHGGVQFTALDCMAGWAVFVLRNPEREMPLTTAATIRFRRPRASGSVSTSRRRSCTSRLLTMIPSCCEPRSATRGGSS